MKVNLGPVAPTLNATGVVPQQGNGLNYNPRCLRRDISPWVSSTFNKDADSKSLITQNPDIYWFQTKMQGEFDKGAYGVHTGGHFTYQGDPAGDLFTSPGDPMFWLHHAQIDRTYWMWQNQDMDKRLYQISGKVSFLDPNSRNGTLDDIIDMGVLARNVKIRDVMDTSGGTLCYIYL